MNILVNSDSIKSFSNTVQVKNSQLVDEFNILLDLLDQAKQLINSNNGSLDDIDDIKNDITEARSGINSFNINFLNTLNGILISYREADQATISNVSTLDEGTVALTIGAGGLAASGFDFTKVSSNAHDASTGDFIKSDKVHDDYFKEGEYTFQYRKDGTVRIDKNGVPMAFTTRENADKVTGGINNNGSANNGDTVNSGNGNSEQTTNANDNAEPLVGKKDTAGRNLGNDFKNVADDVIQKRQQDEALYGNGPWSSVSITKKKGGFGYGDRKIIQQSTYYEGSNKRTMVVLDNGQYVVVTGGKVDSVNAFNTIPFNPLSEEKANSMLTYETRKKIYEYQQANLK